MALTRGVCQLALLQRGAMYDNDEFNEAGGSPADSGRVAPTASDKFEVLIVVLLLMLYKRSAGKRGLLLSLKTLVGTLLFPHTPDLPRPPDPGREVPS
jgi:hypothetical protein